MSEAPRVNEVTRGSQGRLWIFPAVMVIAMACIAVRLAQFQVGSGSGERGVNVASTVQPAGIVAKNPVSRGVAWFERNARRAWRRLKR